MNYIEIWYIHRGAKNDIKMINGSEIISIEKSFIRTSDSMIPHHRIFKILYESNVLFERKET